jgi:ubiquinone biosynthesis protein
MPNASAVPTGAPRFTADQLRTALAGLVPENATRDEKVGAIETALRSVAGLSLRDAMATWIVDEVVPVSRLVPESYLKWRPPVRDAMTFVVARLSPGRLAPKLLEQLELPPKTPPEARLLRLIAKVPGLQKLGQVIARNRHLRPASRRALARLENGIRDVRSEEIRAILQHNLGPRLKKHVVRISPTILSEASVSAVVQFTWRNPKTGKRERGVFKVLKPHIPEYFAEDMDYLQKLAEYFGDQHHTYGFPPRLIPDTFEKVRRLLQHEVNFRREQKTLTEAARLYHNVAGVCVPHVIRQLCTRRITALTQEPGIKITSAVARLSPQRRRRVAEELVEALVAYPLLSAEEKVVFHGDPHAGNILYDRQTRQMTLIDWALQERLSREQRRHMVLLFAMLALRDSVGTCGEIIALSPQKTRTARSQREIVAQTVEKFLEELPLARLPSMVDAMQLLERAALAGIRFPKSLIMLSKVMFTLDGLLSDIGGSNSRLGFAIARHLAQRWLVDRKSLRSPLRAKDWLTLQCSALLYSSRLWMRWEKAMLDRVLPSRELGAVPS